jgi:hypothetical protein
MNSDALFNELEPPKGGADRFARRLDELDAAQRSPRRAMFAAAAAVAAMALVTALLVLRHPSTDVPVLVADAPPAVDVYNAPELDRLLGRSQQPSELVVKVNEQTAAVTELTTTNEKVRIYQIN